MSIESLVNFYKGKPLTGDHILKTLDVEPILYSDLSKYKSIDDVLGVKGYAVLIYQVTRYDGHYVSIFKDDNNNLNFSDPYGFAVDAPIDDNLVPFDKPLPRYLTQLISKSKYKLIQNNFDYQSKQATVQDCGRHAILRIKLRHMTNEQYKRLLVQSSVPFLNCDNIVVLLTLLSLDTDIVKFYNK